MLKESYGEIVQDQLVRDVLQLVKDNLLDPLHASGFVYYIDDKVIAFRLVTYITHKVSMISPAGIKIIEGIKALGFNSVKFIDKPDGTIEVGYSLEQK